MRQYNTIEKPTKYTALSSIIGVKREGFYENCASKIKNLRPAGGTFRLRNGIMKGYPVSGEVKCAQSVNVGGYITSFLVIDRFIYEIEESGYGEEISEVRYESPYELNPSEIFFFSVGNEICFFDGKKILKYADSEFLDTEGGIPDVEVKLPYLPFIRKTVTDEGMNLLNGRLHLSFTLPCDTSSVTFESAPAAVDYVYINGALTGGIELSGSVLALPEPRKKGDNLVISLRYSVPQLSAHGFISASEESEERAYIHSQSKLFRATSVGGFPVIQRTPLSLSAGGIKKVFFVSGIPAVAIGAGISVYDEEDGTLRLIDCEGVERASDICPAGGFAFLSTASEILKLTLTRSGEGENLVTVSMKDHFTDRDRRRNLAMAYSRADGCLYTVSESGGVRSIEVLDTESGVWFSVEGIESPKRLFECADSIVIVNDSSVWFTSPDMDSDYDYETEEFYPIKGEITLSESFLGDPMGTKRLKYLATTLSGKVASFKLCLSGDNERYDEYLITCENSWQKKLFDIFRMNIGRFKSLSLKAILSGYGDACLHDVYIMT